MKYAVHLDLNKNQLQNALLHPLAAAPSSPAVGQGYYDTVLVAPRYWDGAGWTLKATDSLLLGGSNLAAVLSRSNHTGTQTASTISDFNTAVRTNRLDQMASPTASIAMNSQQFTGLATPTQSDHAATMGYVQSQVQSAAAGIDSKPSVRLATTVNDTLAGLAARDGITPVAGDRVLVKNQTTASQNGVYVAAAGAWTRATDADATGELTPGAFWFVEEGSTQAATQWRISNSGAITLDSTAITIVQFGASSSYTGSTTILLTGSAFSVIVKPSGGILTSGTGIEIDTAIVVRKYAATIGDGTTNPITVTHNLGTKDVMVMVREVATDAIVIADVTASTTNSITVGFAVVPTANQYRVVVQA